VGSTTQMARGTRAPQTGKRLRCLVGQPSPVPNIPITTSEALWDSRPGCRWRGPAARHAGRVPHKPVIDPDALWGSFHLCPIFQSQPRMPCGVEVPAAGGGKAHTARGTRAPQTGKRLRCLVGKPSPVSNFPMTTSDALWGSRPGCRHSS